MTMNFRNKNFLYIIITMILIFIYSGCSPEGNMFYQNGMESYKAGDLRNALIEFNKAIDFEPNNALYISCHREN